MNKAFPFVFDFNFYPEILLWAGMVSFMSMFYVRVVKVNCIQASKEIVVDRRTIDLGIQVN